MPGLAEIGEDELERLRQERPEIVESIRADAVDISGFPARSLLRRI